MSSDLWTSKGSVYAFAGVALFWITEDWCLKICPADLLPLYGDHSGKAVARIIYRQTLRPRKITKRLCKALLTPLDGTR